MPFLPQPAVSAETDGVQSALPPQTEAEQTVAACLADLAPEQPVAVRRRAALIVGKYTSESAGRALAAALRDTDAIVRRNALVSTGEASEHLRHNGMAVLRCLADPDVTNRRLASSLAPHCLPHTGGLACTPLSRREWEGLYRRQGAAEKAEITRLLDAALGDSDPAVRKNALAAARFYPADFSLSHLRPFFVSPCREERTAAWRLFVGNTQATPAEISGLLRQLAESPVPDERRVFFDIVGDAPRSCARNALLSLMEAPEVAEAAQAMAAYCRFYGLATPPPPHKSREAFAEQLFAFVRHPQVPPPLRAELARSALQLEPSAAPSIACDQSLPGTVRAAAWQHRAAGGNMRVPLGELLEKLTQEKDPGCQRVIFQIIAEQYGDGLAPEHWRALLDSASAEVRASAVTLAGEGHSAASRIDLVREALLDDNDEVRLRAVRIIARLKPDGWVDDMLATLEDPAPALNECAALALTAPALRSLPHIREALAAYLPRCRNQFVRNRIRTVFGADK